MMASTVYERASAVFTGSLVDTSSDGVGYGSLTTLTLTLVDVHSGAVINGRNAQDVLSTDGLSTNDVVVSSSGLVTWELRPEDNVIVDPALPSGAQEIHLATFAWTWGSSSTKQGSAEQYFAVTARRSVP